MIPILGGLGIIGLVWWYKEPITISLKKYTNMIKQYLTFKLFLYLIESDKTHYTITYPYMMDWYKIKIKKNRKPVGGIHAILDKHGNNVLEEVKPYLGPGHDFHGYKVTPEHLGYEELIFNYRNGESKTFKNIDIIQGH